MTCLNNHWDNRHSYYSSGFRNVQLLNISKKKIDLRAFQDICQSWNSNILICKFVHVTYVYGFWLLSRKKLIEHGLFQERYRSWNSIHLFLCYCCSSSSFINVLLLGTFSENNMSGSLQGCLPKLEFKYFHISVFNATAIVFLVPEMYNY